MPHVYTKVRELQHSPKVDGGQCVRLVQHFTNVGHTSTWRRSERVLDAKNIAPGTVIANFDRNGRWPAMIKGNHAAFFVEFGPRRADGNPAWIVVMDQWPDKSDIHMRRIERRGLKMHEEGNRFDDSDNAELFWIVK